MPPTRISTGPPAAPAPDSPRSSQSPPPVGVQGDLELELLGLANALYNLGTTVVNDSTKEKDKVGVGKQVGLRVNEAIGHLATIDDMSQHIQTMIPMQVLADIDNGRNPMHLTKDRLERTATENQFMNGKIRAIETYRSLLDEAMMQSFPELTEFTHETGTDAGASHNQAQQSHPPFRSDAGYIFIKRAPLSAIDRSAERDGWIVSRPISIIRLQAVHDREWSDARLVSVSKAHQSIQGPQWEAIVSDYVVHTIQSYTSRLKQPRLVCGSSTVQLEYTCQ